MDDDNYDDYDAPAPSGALTHGISTKPVEAPPAAAPTYEEIEPAPKAAAPAAAAAQRTTGGASTSQPVGAVESARSLVQRANREEGIDWYLNLSEDQLNRYECFKNTNLFPTGQAGAGAAGARGKKAILAMIGGERMVDRSDAKQVDRLVLVLGGVTKVFIAELTERARLVAVRCGQTGALLPLHYQAAYDELVQEGKVPGKQPKKKQRFIG